MDILAALCVYPFGDRYQTIVKWLIILRFGRKLERRLWLFWLKVIKIRVRERQAGGYGFKKVVRIIFDWVLHIIIYFQHIRVVIEDYLYDNLEIEI